MVYEWQHKIKLCSESLILYNLELYNTRFDFLVDNTKLSRPVLAKRLKELMKKGLVEQQIEKFHIVYCAKLTEKQFDIVRENIRKIAQVQELLNSLTEI